MHHPDFIHFVTSRCEHGMFFLLPKKKTNELIKFWLAKAKHLEGKHIEIFAFTFMANHYHMLLRDPKGELPRFMDCFLGNLARSMNKLLNRRGRFWGSRYNDAIVDGEESFWNVYAWLVLNPVKAGLVADASHWGGVSSHGYAMSGLPVVGEGYDETDRYNKRRNRRKPDMREINEEEHESWSFELAVCPGHEGMGLEERRAHIRGVLASCKAEYLRRREHRPALGMKKVLSLSPYARPREEPKRGVKNSFIARGKARFEELWEIYQMFSQAYAMFSKLLKERGSGCFGVQPLGSYLPGMHSPYGAMELSGYT